MPFKLSKDELRQRDELVAQLRAASDAVTAAVEAFNEALDGLKEPVTAALEKYNEVLAEARGFADDVASQADQDISEKSERWQEGERGLAAGAWQSEWSCLPFDDLDITLPEPIDYDEPDHAGVLEEAPEEAAT